jgi:protein subunit release factor B
MQALGIHDSDLEEKFILGSGRGGQKINKTASCVQLSHLPTGLVIKCQKDRSREMNRFLARRELCRKLEEQLTGTSREQQQADKIRKQKQRRQRRQRVARPSRPV